MSEADILYADVKFTGEVGITNGTDSSETVYSELKIPKIQPSTQLPGSQQQLVSNGRSKVTLERVALVVLSVLLAAASIALARILYKNTQNTELLQKLTDELNATRRNHTAEKCRDMELCNTCPEPPVVIRNESCPACGEDWEQYGAKCYYFSTTRLSWEESRLGCKGRGGDLARINTEEEQTFLERKVRQKMGEAEDKFWIGLTDSKKEAMWLWVDDSPLNPRLSFWGTKEPDNWLGENGEYPDGEDCVRLGEPARIKLKSWFDTACERPFKSICDKPVKTFICA